MTRIEKDVWDTVQALNRAWTQGHVEELVDYFHADIVAVTPTDRERLEGRDACLTSWARFVESATIESWTEISPRVQVYGSAAVVTYYYDLRCRSRGTDLRLEGRDMMVLIREDGRWWVVADQFSAYPA